MKYLIKTGFKGWLAEDLDLHTSRKIQSQTEQQIISESKIKDLGILTMLAMLRIDLFQEANTHMSEPQKHIVHKLYRTGEKKFLTLKKMISELTFTPLNSIIVIAFQQVLHRIEVLQQAAGNSLLGMS